MKALSFAERLRRAEEALREARSIRLPAAGRERGPVVRHKQSVIRRGKAWVARLAGHRPPATATDQEIAAARRLWQALDAEWPEVLDGRRRR